MLIRLNPFAKFAKRMTLLAEAKCLNRGRRSVSIEELIVEKLAAEDLVAKSACASVMELLWEQVSIACGKCVEDCKSRCGAIEGNVVKRLKK